MGVKLIDESILGDVANAIRERTGVNSKKIATVNMANEILNIHNRYDARNINGSGIMVFNGSEWYNDQSSASYHIVSGNDLDISYKYANCYKLKGSPWCFDEPYLPFPIRVGTYNMSHAYYHCYNITGNPVAPTFPHRSFDFDFTNTYRNCYNLTGSPVCPEVVIGIFRFDGTYYGCNNLTGTPVTSISGVSMNETYAYCSNLTGVPIMPISATNLVGTFKECTNLDGVMIFAPSLNNIYQFAYNARMNNIGIDCNDIMGDRLTNIKDAFNLAGWGDPDTKRVIFVNSRGGSGKLVFPRQGYLNDNALASNIFGSGVSFKKIDWDPVNHEDNGYNTITWTFSKLIGDPPEGHVVNYMCACEPPIDDTTYNWNLSVDKETIRTNGWAWQLYYSGQPTNTYMRLITDMWEVE